MPRASYPKLVAALRNPAGGVFFLSGDEHFLREEAVRRVVEAHLDPATADFNLDQLRGSDASAEAVASLSATPPMMARWRVVVIRDAQGLGARARTTVEQLAESPPEGLALVLSATIPPGSSASFYRTLERAATSVRFDALGPLDAPAWIAERAEQLHGARMDTDAARALVAAVGTDLGTLVAELHKLLDAGSPGVVTTADVERVVGPIARVNRWAWVDLVAERRFAEAHGQIPDLLAAGESGVGLIIALGASVTRIAVALAGGERALEPVLGRRAGAIQQAMRQARAWTLSDAEGALAELLRTDRLLKSGGPSESQAMEELLLRLRAMAAVASGSRAA